ncbi:hypothetical protein DFJ74DRAFT_756955 [Hyaloraphidium curvatum]|nr:hypothetical protein DFJ74DRAFT_756955 [Hyaloraphidium curvatum]
MCLVLSQLSAESAAKRAAVEDTWGRDCDVLRFVVSSPNASGADPAQGLAGTPHGDRFIVLPRAAKEDRIALFANVRAALLLAARQYASVADWFLKLDDDSLLLAGNFRAYVRGHFPDPGVPRYVGRRLKFAGMPAHHYNTGSGYALNRAALREFAAAVAQGHHSCLQHGFEDVLVARCLAQRGILPEDTRDAMGRERFSYLRPDELFDGKLIATLKWYRLQSYNLEPGEGCCSMEPVLFHRLEPRLMRVTLASGSTPARHLAIAGGVNASFSPTTIATGQPTSPGKKSHRPDPHSTRSAAIPATPCRKHSAAALLTPSATSGASFSVASMSLTDPSGSTRNGASAQTIHRAKPGRSRSISVMPALAGRIPDFQSNSGTPTTQGVTMGPNSATRETRASVAASASACRHPAEWPVATSSAPGGSTASTRRETSAAKERKEGGACHVEDRPTPGRSTHTRRVPGGAGPGGRESREPGRQWKCSATRRTGPPSEGSDALTAAALTSACTDFCGRHRKQIPAARPPISVPQLGIPSPTAMPPAGSIYDKDAVRAEIHTFLREYIPCVLARGDVSKYFAFPVYLSDVSFPTTTLRSLEEAHAVFDAVAKTAPVPAKDISPLDIRVDLHGPNTAVATVLWKFSDAGGRETFRETGLYFLQRFKEGWRITGAGRVMGDPEDGDGVEASMKAGGASRDPKWRM